MQIQGTGFLLFLVLAVLLCPPSLANTTLDAADATACKQRFAVALFRVQGADGVIPDGLTASTRELESGEPVEDTGVIAIPGTVFLADDSMRDRFLDGDLDLVTTLRVGDREYELVHRVGLDPSGCHVMLKGGSPDFVLED